MRLLIICLCLLWAAPAFSQSKKELQEEVKTLKSQIELVKTENEQLKKPKEVNLTDPHKKASYGLGVLIGTNVKSQGGDSLDLDILTAAMRDVFAGTALKMDQQECMAVVQEYMQKAAEQKGAVARSAGKAFLESNKKQAGVTETASGLQYKVITSGKGKTPGPGDQVTVHYTGKLTDGTVFDSSVERGTPATFGVGQVIRGWTEALQLMKEGDKWTLFIPDTLGYGERGSGGQIPPYSVLVFDVELIKVN
jgi:FKBP-type peptidyl-prolyl cis-trans isomerase